MRNFICMVLALLLANTLAWADSNALSMNPAGSRDGHPPGTRLFSPDGHVEYVVGDAPVIITAPHGGQLMPSDIPDRVPSACGGRAVTVQDRHTAELARAMQAQFHTAHGTLPHLVIMHLHRRKVDANRAGVEAACGHPVAQAAVDDWHQFVETAKRSAVRDHGKAWIMDIHGHGHPNQRLELGYLLGGRELALHDAQLDADADAARKSSVYGLIRDSGLPLSAVLRGPHSLGSLYAAHGFPAVPSGGDRAPGWAPYFEGGANTLRHTCSMAASQLGGLSGGPVCGVQVETHYRGLRDDPLHHTRFGEATAAVLHTFLRTHWNLDVKRRAVAATSPTPGP